MAAASSATCRNTSRSLCACAWREEEEVEVEVEVEAGSAARCSGIDGIGGGDADRLDPPLPPPPSRRIASTAGCAVATAETIASESLDPLIADARALPSSSSSFASRAVAGDAGDAGAAGDAGPPTWYGGDGPRCGHMEPGGAAGQHAVQPSV